MEEALNDLKKFCVEILIDTTYCDTLKITQDNSTLAIKRTNINMIMDRQIYN